MDRKSSQRLVQTIVLLSLGLGLSGCKSGPYKLYQEPTGLFTCEIPSDWKDIRLAHHSGLGFMAPEGFREVPVSLSIHPAGEPISKMTRSKLAKHLEGERKIWAGSPNYTQEPMREYQVGPFVGIGYSWTRMAEAPRHHRETPHPGPVLYKETEIYFDTPDGSFYVQYGAPMEVYERHRPHFEHLLATLRWRGR